MSFATLTCLTSCADDSKTANFLLDVAHRRVSPSVVCGKIYKYLKLDSGVSRGGALGAPAPPLRHHFNIAARMTRHTTGGGVRVGDLGPAREGDRGT